MRSLFTTFTASSFCLASRVGEEPRGELAENGRKEGWKTKAGRKEDEGRNERKEGRKAQRKMITVRNQGYLYLGEGKGREGGGGGYRGGFESRSGR
jgi:hypothetical protein